MPTQPAIGRLSLAALHGGGEGNASGAEGRKNSEENASDEGDGGSERENAGVDREVEEHVVSGGGKIADQEGGSPTGKEESE